MFLLDCRGLEPPEPMMRVLEAVAELVAGDELEVLNDRRPMFLYPILEAQGLDCETEERPEGHVVLRIRRKA